MKMRQQMRTMARLILLLLLLWVGVSVSTELDLQKRVIGGQPCLPHDRLYHVRLRTTFANGDRGFCGGSLITDQWILTAGHCVTRAWSIVAELGVHPGPGQQVTIRDLPVIYRQLGEDHDVALLRLPATFRHNIRPISVCQHRLNQRYSVQIAGHGATTTGPYDFVTGLYIRQPGFTPVLHCAYTTIVNCQLHINYPGIRIPERVICGQRPGVDSCKGDSGGGVVQYNSIYGIILGDNARFPCRTPSIFLDVCYGPYLQWIRQTTGNTGGHSGLNCFGCGG